MQTIPFRAAWSWQNPADLPRTELARIRSRLRRGTGSAVNCRTIRRRQMTSWKSMPPQGTPSC